MTAVQERAVAAGVEAFGFGTPVEAGPIPAPGESLPQAAPVAKEQNEAAAPAQAKAPIKVLTIGQRLALLADQNNNDYPLQIVGPNGEKYISGVVVRAVALAAAETMGWCDHGVNSGMSYLGLPKIREGANTGIIRKFTAKVTLVDRNRANGYTGVQHVLPDKDVILAHIKGGIDRYTHPGQTWTCELGDLKTSTRKTVVLDENDQVIEEQAEITNSTREVSIVGYFQAEQAAGMPSAHDLATVKTRAIAMLHENYKFGIANSRGGNDMSDAVRDIEVEDAVGEDQLDVFRDSDLKSAMKRMLGGNYYNLRGYDQR